MAGLYIHIPYCHAKCYYCDFYSLPDARSASRYVEAVVAEAALRSHELINELKTIYIGGGTPSSLDDDLLRRLVEGVSQSIDLSNVLEFTIEVNPEDVTETKLDALAGLGVNRVSMGVQTLEDGMLTAIGRRHTAREAIEAARMIKDRFPNMSLDLMYGLPGQSMEDLDRTLDGIIGLDAPHLSAYLLSYEPGTRLYAMMMAGKVKEADDEMAGRMHDLVRTRLADAGYVHYEISNFARPGMESRHNSSYWDSTPYLGLGVSAHSFDGDVRRYNRPSVKGYIDAICDRRTTFYNIDEESIENKFNDFLITRLRTRKGIERDRLSNDRFNALLDRIEGTIQRLVSMGQLVDADGRITIPADKWLVADSILRELIV